MVCITLWCVVRVAIRPDFAGHIRTLGVKICVRGDFLEFPKCPDFQTAAIIKKIHKYMTTEREEFAEWSGLVQDSLHPSHPCILPIPASFPTLSFPSLFPFHPSLHSPYPSIHPNSPSLLIEETECMIISLMQM